MKKLLIIAILLILALTTANNAEAHTVSGASARLVSEVKTKTDVRLYDTRVKALENVFDSYGSILKSEAIHYVRYADEYGIDWRLLAAISGLESGFAKRYVIGSYNAYGWGGGYIYFKSWEDGIRTISKSLSERYYARGATDVWSIGPIYAESPTWAVRVNSFMQKIQKEYERLSILSAAPTI